MPISIGKLSLYVAGAGIRPSSTLPICLDLGTNNEEFLADPLYLGLRQKVRHILMQGKLTTSDPLFPLLPLQRVSDVEMAEFMNEFMREMSTHFPELLVQFEVCIIYHTWFTRLTVRVHVFLQDFSTENAFKYLDLYRNKYPTFNDDIQGLYPAQTRLDFVCVKFYCDHKARGPSFCPVSSTLRNFLLLLLVSLSRNRGSSSSELDPLVLAWLSSC